MKNLPPVEYLRECFSYDSETGELTWKRRPREHFATQSGWKIFNRHYAGTCAGTINNLGYRHILVQGRHYTVHRIIWKLITDEEPPEFLDHIDGNKSNNRFINLRSATRTQQRWNSRLNKDNLCGRRGVQQRGNQWIARINVNGVSRYLGRFNTVEMAAEVYETAARELHGEFYREQKA
jgi:hypothetical protein